jgi:hypothetical protein
MVYTPAGSRADGFDFLILDQWNSLDGLNQFFANPEVQREGSQIFANREPVVWKAAEGFYSYHFPAHNDRNKRIAAVVYGEVGAQEEACTVRFSLFLDQITFSSAGW